MYLIILFPGMRRVNGNGFLFHYIKKTSGREAAGHLQNETTMQALPDAARPDEPVPDR